jgi:hypothetical protein
MTETFFMVDIESTGVDLDRDAVLEIGVLQCVRGPNGYYVPKRTHRQLLPYGGMPESAFAKEHMAALYKECNQKYDEIDGDPKHMNPDHYAAYIRSRLIAFFGSCGKHGHEVTLGGWNASSFDVPMLHRKRYLDPPGYKTGPDGKDRQTGDHNYRYYEIGGAVSLVQDALPDRLERKDVVDAAKDAGATVSGWALPPGKAHSALYDCHKQLQLLNGLIFMAREET